MTYKPCTTAQYRIMEYLRETFETSLCLIYPSRPNAMVLDCLLYTSPSPRDCS